MQYNDKARGTSSPWHDRVAVNQDSAIQSNACKQGVSAAYKPKAFCLKSVHTMLHALLIEQYM